MSRASLQSLLLAADPAGDRTLQQRLQPAAAPFSAICRGLPHSSDSISWTEGSCLQTSSKWVISAREGSRGWCDSRRRPAGLALSSPYLLQHFCSCFLRQVARSFTRHLLQLCAEHACTHCILYCIKWRCHKVLNHDHANSEKFKTFADD